MKLPFFLIFSILISACGSAAARPIPSISHAEDPIVTVTPTPTPTQAPLSDKYFFVAGSIRYDGDIQQWKVIEDSNHQPMNVLRVETADDYAAIWYSEIAYKVVSFLVTPDETFAIRGIEAGASVGLDYALIRFGKDGDWLHSNDLDVPWGNFWFYGVFERKL